MTAPKICRSGEKIKVSEAAPSNGPVILFDGVCNLCNHWVDFVIRRDTAEKFRFASLQSEAGKKILNGRGLPAAEMTGVYLIEPHRVHMKSGAILRIVRSLRAPWPVLSIFLIVPPFLRDAVYDYIAHRRYRWFGKRDTCRLPAAGEKKRFLD